MTSLRLVFLLIASTLTAVFGCSRTPVTLDIYCCETLREPMQEHAKQFMKMTTCNVVIIPIGEETDEKSTDASSPTEQKSSSAASSPETGNAIRRGGKTEQEKELPWSQKPAPGLAWETAITSENAAPETPRETAMLPIEPRSFEGPVNSRILRQIGRLGDITQGDLWITDSARQVEELKRRGLVFREKTVGYLLPVLLVPKGNPKHLFSLDDLANRPLRIGTLQADCGGLGEVGEAVLDQWNRSRLQHPANSRNTAENVSLFPSEQDLLAALAFDMIDVAIAWDATGLRYTEHFDSIPLLGLEQERLTVPIRLILLSSMGDYEYPQEIYHTLRSRQGEQILKRYGIRVN